ncbi:MAG: hypothetical protein CO023_05310, partial [Flavobacteriales bacterium CG_4_9_14_0_2_um_filter_35_242]
DEEGFINDLKTEIDFQFTQINSKNYYFIKKSVRKILRYVKSNIRYSKNKETEIELLLYFCAVLKNSKPSIDQNLVLKNIFIREIAGIKKKVAVLHEDLQYDYKLELDKLLSADKV